MKSPIDEYKERRRLNKPRGSRGLRKHHLGPATVVSPSTVMRSLKKVPARREDPSDPYSPMKSQPSVKATKRVRRVVEVSSFNKHGKLSRFHNPAHMIAQQIQDSLDANKILEQAPSEVRDLDSMKPESVDELERQYGKINREVVDAVGSRVNIVKVVEDREKAVKVLLPNGWTTWIPRACILEQGKFHLRVHRWIKKQRVFRLPPAKKLPGLEKEQVLARLLAKRRKP